jgi:hypothetical protein
LRKDNTTHSATPRVIRTQVFFPGPFVDRFGAFVQRLFQQSDRGMVVAHVLFRGGHFKQGTFKGGTESKENK